jgi:hypothetical protein
MIDALNRELWFGDKVAYIVRSYKELQLGTVMYATQKGARIMPYNSDTEINRVSCQIIKLEDGGYE